MDLLPLISRLLVGVLTMGVIVWLALALMRSRARAVRNPELEARCAAAGFEVTTSLLGAPEVRGTVGETPFVMTATPGADTTPSTTVIRIPGGSRVDFAISREGSRDASGRDRVEAMFPDERCREAVRALFASGFDTLVHQGNALSATRTFKAAMLDPEALQAAVARLAVIGAATDVRATPDWRVPSAGSTRIAVASIVLLVAGVVLFALGLSHGGAVLAQAWPGLLAAYLLLSALAAFILRGRPLARGETSFVVGMALPGLVLGGCGIAMMG